MPTPTHPPPNPVDALLSLKTRLKGYLDASLESADSAPYAELRNSARAKSQAYLRVIADVNNALEHAAKANVDYQLFLRRQVNK